MQRPFAMATRSAAGALMVVGFLSACGTAQKPDITTAPPPEPAPQPERMRVKVEPPSHAAPSLKNRQPDYPPESLDENEQGRVVLRVRVEPDGSASSAEVIQSSGHERLDNSARTTALSWRYLPGKRNGKPAAMWATIPFRFALE